MHNDLKIKVNKKELYLGLFLVVLGIIMPSIIHVHNMKIYSDIDKSLATFQKIYIVIAAGKLVLLNSIRSFPHYLGAFFIAEAFKIKYKDSDIKTTKALVICLIIPLVYVVIEKFYHIKYDFGIPALSMIAMLVVISKIDFNMVNITKKSLMVAMMIVAFQWLDVMPSLSPYAFGRGETSNDIKMVAELLESVELLQYVAMFFMLLFLFNSLILGKLVRDENNIMIMIEEKKKAQKELMDTQMRILESRTYMELQHLVHDLKSPLTSVQTLVGVVKLAAKDEKTCEYLTKIEASVERMSRMISEILYGNQTSRITTKEMISSIMSQISGSEYVGMVEVLENPDNLYMNVNKIRFSRAIINLLENAFYAMDGKRGKINVSVYPYEWMDGSYAKIVVKDAGKGISQDKIKDVWKNGYSTKGSLGFGLSFVQKVVDDNSGAIEMESTEGKGTTVTIIMPIET